MKCPYCGFELPEGSDRCESCGGLAKGERISDNIRFCEDGKYRWVYEVNLWRNASAVLETLRFLFLISLGIWALFFLLRLGDGVAAALKGSAEEAGVIFGIMAGLTLISYPVYALLMGGRYAVLFEMDEKQIEHVRMEKQVTREELVDWLWQINEVLESDALGTFLGVRTEESTSLISEYEYVKKLRLIPKRNLISVKGPMTANQVYAEAEDLDFVWNYLKEHCPGAKVTGERDV